MSITDVIRKAIDAGDYTVDGIVAAGNYCLREILNDPDSEIYDFNDFCDLLDECEMKASDIICKCRFGDFDFSKDFYGFDGYANFRSLYSWEADDEAKDHILDALDNCDIYTDFSELLDLLDIDPDDYWDADDDDETDDDDDDETESA